MKKLILLGYSALLAACMPVVDPSCVNGASQDELQVWSAAQSSGKVSDYRNYLRKYPKGCFASKAMRSLEQTTTQVRAQRLPEDGGGGGGGLSTPY